MKTRILITLFLSLVISFCTSVDKKKKKCNETIKVKYNSKVVNIPLGICAKKQNVENRIWRDISLEYITTFGGLQDTNILHPTIIRPDSSGNIFFIDIGDYSIKKYSSTGVFLEKYGRYGKGPGEFITPHRFTINHGQIGVIDPNLKKIVVFNKKEIKEKKLDLAPLHIASLSKNEFVIFQIINPIDHSIVQKINILDFNIIDYDNIFEPNSIGVDFGIFPFLIGDIYSNKKNLFFIPELLDFFIIYSKTGSIKLVRKTIDERIIPSTKNKRITNSKGEKVFATSFHFPKEQYVNKRMNVTDKYLYITSSRASIEYDCYVIDVYSAKSGNYKFSFKLKNIKKTNDIYFTDDKIYLIDPNTTIKVFRYFYR